MNGDLRIDSVSGWPSDIKKGIPVDICRAMKEVESVMSDEMILVDGYQKCRISRGALIVLLKFVRSNFSPVE